MNGPVHLHVRSWYSFLAGGSSPEELVTRAVALGQKTLAITDTHGVYGAVRFAAACKRAGMRPLIGATVFVADEPLVLLARHRDGYAQLCRLLTAAHRRQLAAGGDDHDRHIIHTPYGSFPDSRFSAKSSLREEPAAPDETLLPIPVGSDRPPPGVDRLDGPYPGVICLSGGPGSKLERLIRARRTTAARAWLDELRAAFPDGAYVELVHGGRPGDAELLARTHRFASQCDVPTVATNAVRFATTADFARYDALTCARLGITVGDRHSERPVNDRAELCSAADLAERVPFADALANTATIAEQCQLELLPGEVTPPSALLPPGVDRNDYLRHLCQSGLEQRYAATPTDPVSVPVNNMHAMHFGSEKSVTDTARHDTSLVRSACARSPAERRVVSVAERAAAEQQLAHELEVVIGLDLAEFFLVVYEVISFARSRGIRCAGRGSAANSIIAYLLGITAVDPLAHHLLFERFLHRGRKGMPDIDVDFDSERRPEVIAWMEQRFGADHCAMTATLQTYRLRGAMREMMKVLGFDLETVDRVARLISSWDSLDDMRARRDEIEAITGPTPLLDVLFALAAGVRGCPRHLGLHNGGMVLTREPLRFFSPIQTSAGGFREVQFDKDDVEALGLIKFDVLGLRTLAVLSEAVNIQYDGTGQQLDIDHLRFDDEPTFELIRRGETMAVFQIESPGQMNLLSRTQPRTLNDLIAQVALFRPGPLQGGMVNPYVARREGVEEVKFLHPVLAPILADTHGIILFQEQVLEICHRFAGLSLEEADEFRRLMSKWRDPGDMAAMGERFIASAMAHLGTDLIVAREMFRQVSAFVGYGFCRSHAAAFARTVYQTAWLKTHFPAAYMAAVLEHKPGFFPMSTVLEEAKRMGVQILPVDAWRSGPGYRLERLDEARQRGAPLPGAHRGSGTTPDIAVRIPLTQVKGISREVAERFWARLAEYQRSARRG